MISTFGAVCHFVGMKGGLPIAPREEQSEHRIRSSREATKME